MEIRTLFLKSGILLKALALHLLYKENYFADILSNKIYQSGDLSEIGNICLKQCSVQYNLCTIHHCVYVSQSTIYLGIQDCSPVCLTRVFKDAVLLYSVYKWVTIASDEFGRERNSKDQATRKN